MYQFEDLCDQLALYLDKDKIEQISLAYEVAFKAHEGQLRSSGDPYITHPLEVARIIASMQMDHQSIMAAILHDVLEDTPVHMQEINEKFGAKVAELVDGVSKLDQIKFESNIEAQASNLRKMMLAMSNDVRVILIKLADRLHNMRTLDVLPREKQRRIALETLEIYAPIAHRLGMHKFRIEFEDLGFTYLYPVRYRVLKEAIKKSRGNRKRLVSEIEKNLQSILDKENVKIIAIIGREKHLYSLYKKMKKKDLSLSEVMDIYAVRIITKNVDDCYRALGVVHTLYKPVHTRIKDYIAVPKSNSYQSLHTTVLGPHGVPVEIQIRTKEMNYMAEDGIAAHWIYKLQKEGVDAASLKAKKWMKGLLDLRQSTGNEKEFLENVKIDLYPDDVYVFTPNGDIWSLPFGATAVDFAYAIHSDIGNSCVAAKINRRLVPLSSRLQSGQTVEIITTKNSHPNPTWLGFVVTGKARSNIRHWLKSQEISESIELGKRLITKALRALSLKLEEIKEENLKKVLQDLKLLDIDKLFIEIGLGNFIAPLIARKLAVDVLKKGDKAIAPLAIKGTEGIIVTYGKCCRPIPDDQIVGFLSTGRGMVVHRENCNNITSIMERNPEKYVFVKWANNVKGEFKVELKIDVINKRGILATIANAISDSSANIENVQIDERDGRHNILVFLLQVKDRVHLATVIRNLRKINLVTSVHRVK